MDALYRDYILDHYKNPRNFGELEPHDLEFHDHNPLCGDELGVHIVVEDGKVAQLRFHGHGCAISQATASITRRSWSACRCPTWPSSTPTGSSISSASTSRPRAASARCSSLKVMRGATTGDASWPE